MAELPAGNRPDLPAKYERAKRLLREKVEHLDRQSARLRAEEAVAGDLRSLLAREREAHESSRRDYARVVGLVRAERDEAAQGAAEARAHLRDALAQGAQLRAELSEAQGAVASARGAAEEERAARHRAEVRAAELEGELGSARQACEGLRERAQEVKIGRAHV